MKRVIYYISLTPKIPMPQIETPEYKFSCDSSFFLVSEKPIPLTHFKILGIPEFEGTFAFVGRGFTTFLNEEELRLISVTHAHFTQFIAKSVLANFYNEYKLAIIPVMQVNGLNDWYSTVEWMRQFNEPKNVSAIFSELLIRHDRKNNGRSLFDFIRARGRWINKFMHFCMSIDVPLDDYVQNHSKVNNIEVTKKEIVGIAISVKLQELLIDRVVKKENSRRSQYAVIRSIMFGETCGNITSNRNDNNKKCLELRDHSQFAPDLPMLDLVPLDRDGEFQGENGFFQSLDISNGRQRIKEVNTRRELIEPLIQRMPVDFKPPEPTLLYPLELTYLSPIPQSHVYLAHLLNPIADQIRPALSGHQPIVQTVARASSLIEKSLSYKFRNLNLLRTALTDVSLPKIIKKSLPTNSRMVFLGESILNMICSNGISVVNRNESTVRMNELKVMIVGGEFFLQVLVRIGLEKCFLSQAGGPNPSCFNTKHAKDLMFALFGAIFADSSLSECFNVFKKIMNLDNKSISGSIFRRSPIGMQTLNYFSNLSLKSSCTFSPTENNNENSISNENISDVLDIEIEDQSAPLFREAFTDSLNKGLSYFGEAFIRCALSINSFQKFPYVKIDVLQYITYLHIMELFEIMVKKNIAQYVVEQSHFDVSYNPSNQVLNKAMNAIFGAVALNYGYSTAIQYLCRDIIDNYLLVEYGPCRTPQEELEYTIWKQSKSTPKYQQYTSAAGKTFTFMSIRKHNIPLFGVGKDSLESQYDLVKKVGDAIAENHNFIQVLLLARKKDDDNIDDDDDDDKEGEEGEEKNIEDEHVQFTVHKKYE